MADPTPYDTHGSAIDPEGFQRGFERAAAWLQTADPTYATRVHDAIANSTGRPWPDTATRIGFRPTPYSEGLALGIYGLVALKAVDG